MNRGFRTIVLLAGCVGAAFAVPPEVTMQFVGTEKPSSFPKQLYVHILNSGYTPFDLSKAMAGATLIVDGKPAKWIGKTYDGPPGIGPVGEWDGCLRAQDFSLTIAPGSHKASLRVGGGESGTQKMKWFEPVNWRKGNLKGRLKEVQQLAVVMIDGMPRSCVENWLTVKDGGFVEGDRVRYFLEPDIKVVVPYRQTFVSGRERTIVDGPPRIYQEPQNPD